MSTSPICSSSNIPTQSTSALYSTCQKVICVSSMHLAHLSHICVPLLGRRLFWPCHKLPWRPCTRLRRNPNPSTLESSTLLALSWARRASRSKRCLKGAPTQLSSLPSTQQRNNATTFVSPTSPSEVKISFFRSVDWSIYNSWYREAFHFAWLPAGYVAVDRLVYDFISSPARASCLQSVRAVC